ncbi:hypothetical protein B0H12DRAFT_1067269 [Mycena haematopus]|nr:hypothetical protein B0H12DRAFT_1067269 [Mycena haematopus]
MGNRFLQCLGLFSAIAPVSIVENMQPSFTMVICEDFKYMLNLSVISLVDLDPRLQGVDCLDGTSTIRAHAAGAVDEATLVDGFLKLDKEKDQGRLDRISSERQTKISDFRRLLYIYRDRINDMDKKLYHKGGKKYISSPEQQISRVATQNISSYDPKYLMSQPKYLERGNVNIVRSRGTSGTMPDGVRTLSDTFGGVLAGTAVSGWSSSNVRTNRTALLLSLSFQIAAAVAHLPPKLISKPKEGGVESGTGNGNGETSAAAVVERFRGEIPHVFLPFMVLPTPPRTIAEFIQQHRHPVISSVSISTATKDVSKAERELPRKLQCVMSKSDWVARLKARYNFDVQIPEHYYVSHPWLLGAFYLAVQERSREERQEADTHAFHRSVLEAVVSIAAAYVDLGGKCAGVPFSDAARAAVPSLKVSAGFHTEDSLIYPDHEISIDVPLVQRWLPRSPSSKTRKAHILLGEDKTRRVMTKLRPKIDAMVANQSYRWPALDAIQSAPSEVRVLTQVWAQLCAHRADNDPAGWISKLYASSPAGSPGLHCFFKLVDEVTLEVSEWYTDSDSVENTLVVLLYSLEQLFTNPDNRTLPSNSIDRPPLSAGSSAGYSVYRWKHTWPLLFLIRFFWYIIAIIGDFFGRPRFNSASAFLELDLTTQDVRLVHASGQVVVFDEIVGQGAVGTAMRSRRDGMILKFGRSSPLLHEATVYAQLAGRGELPIPHYFGFLPFEPQQMAILISDVGDRIDVDEMTPAQRLEPSFYKTATKVSQNRKLVKDDHEIIAGAVQHVCSRGFSSRIQEGDSLGFGATPNSDSIQESGCRSFTVIMLPASNFSGSRVGESRSELGCRFKRVRDPGDAVPYLAVELGGHSRRRRGSQSWGGTKKSGLTELESACTEPAAPQLQRIAIATTIRIPCDSVADVSVEAK